MSLTLAAPTNSSNYLQGVSLKAWDRLNPPSQPPPPPPPAASCQRSSHTHTHTLSPVCQRSLPGLLQQSADITIKGRTHWSSITCARTHAECASPCMLRGRHASNAGSSTVSPDWGCENKFSGRSSQHYSALLEWIFL